MASGNEEHRAYKRFAADEHCWALLENSNKLAVKNISMFGTCLLVPKPYDKESSCRITMCSSTRGNITLTGSVMWSYPMGPEKYTVDSEERRVVSYETGFKFVEMDDTEKKALQEFINGLD